MQERRLWKNVALRSIAISLGLEKGREILVRERSLLKDYTYMTREIRRGVVLELYPYHFYCRMEDGRRESFRYNEFLGYEARLIRLQRKQKAPERMLGDVDSNPLTLGDTTDFILFPAYI